jgi:hypothetical protein
LQPYAPTLSPEPLDYLRREPPKGNRRGGWQRLRPGRIDHPIDTCGESLRRIESQRDAGVALDAPHLEHMPWRAPPRGGAGRKSSRLPTTPANLEIPPTGAARSGLTGRQPPQQDDAQAVPHWSLPSVRLNRSLRLPLGDSGRLSSNRSSPLSTERPTPPPTSPVEGCSVLGVLSWWGSWRKRVPAMTMRCAPIYSGRHDGARTP